MSASVWTVRAEGDRGVLVAGGETIACAIGRGGIRRDKREGDGATPVGRFVLRRLVYRPDRLDRPRTALPASAMAADDGWCDDPGDPDYNRPVRLPHPASHERMWRDDHLYDLVVVIGHNDDPIVPGDGSAVFVHLAREGYAPTEGCVAMTRADLLRLLETASTETVLVVEG